MKEGRGERGERRHDMRADQAGQARKKKLLFVSKHFTHVNDVISV